MLSAAELSKLWRNHAAALLLLARSRCHMPEDCVQEAFIRLATQTPVPDCPVAWLMRVVRNEALTTSRAGKRRRHRELRAASIRQPWFEPSNELLSDTPSAHELQQSLQTLDEETREIVIAHVWGGLTFRQIADAFDLSHATAHRRYESGLQELRRVMQVRQDIE